MSVSYTGIKRALLGTPFPTRDEIHERLDKVRGLAIFASDPIGSNAYATEAIIDGQRCVGADHASRFRHYGTGAAGSF